MNQLDQNLSRPAISDSVTSWTAATRLLSVHGVLPESMLEWVAMPIFRRSSCSGDWTRVSYIAGRDFTVWATREALAPHTYMYIYIYTYIYIYLHSFLDPFPILSLQNIEQSSLCYTVGTCWLCILYIVVCICWSQIPIFIPLSSYPLVTMGVFYICDSIILPLNLASLLSVSQMLHFRMQLWSFTLST